MRSTLLLATACLALSLARPHVASAWDPFTRENAHVRDGNRLFARGDARGALREYDLAAREHPASPEVQLNRGLALLKLNEHARAREAFLRATEPPASPEIRAAAYHDLGLSFYKDADAVAAEDNERAQGLFREAADACRRALRIRPGVRDTAWNLELAMRRIRELEEEQRQQEQQQNQQQQNQQQQAQNQQDQQQQQQQDQQQQDQQQQDQQQQDQQQQDQQQQQAQNQQGQQEQNPQQPPQNQQQQDQQQQQAEQREGQGSQSAREEETAQAEPVDAAENAPEHLRRMLEAIEGSEESLERQRARMRAAREGRRPAQDW